MEVTPLAKAYDDAAYKQYIQDESCHMWEHMMAPASCSDPLPSQSGMPCFCLVCLRI
jgi:hypothetical protein